MQQRVTPARIAFAAAVAALFCFASVGCGSSGSSNLDQSAVKDSEAIVKSGDEASVTGAEVKLIKITINGPISELFQQTQNVVSALQQARSDGVSSAWIDKQISDSEGSVEAVGCHDCFTALEDAR